MAYSKPRAIVLDWREYPTGTRARASGGGWWIKEETGRWRWHPNGAAFPQPGGDAVSVEVPLDESGEEVGWEKR
jgi:hypothetical protein